MLKVLKQIFASVGKLFSTTTKSTNQKHVYREFRSGKRHFRYKVIRDQVVYQRNESDQMNAVIVLPDFESAQHEDILHTSLEEIGQQLNIDSFSVYQDDAVLTFGTKSNELTEEEQQRFRDSFIGVYPGRRR